MATISLAYPMKAEIQFCLWVTVCWSIL